MDGHFEDDCSSYLGIEDEDSWLPEKDKRDRPPSVARGQRSTGKQQQDYCPGGQDQDQADAGEVRPPEV